MIDPEIRLRGYRSQLTATFIDRISGTVDYDTGYIGIDKYHLNYCGREDCHPGHSYGPNKRSAHLIHLVKKGCGTYKTKTMTYRIGENQAFLIFPGEEVYYEADHEDPWFYDWIGFSGNGVAECISNMGFTQRNHVVNVKRTRELSDCVTNILRRRKLTLSDDLYRTAELMRFISIIIDDHENDRFGKTASGRPYSTFVKQAADYITTHYMEQIRINDLAEMIGINRSHLSSRFRKEVNLSPQEFLLALRMGKAASMLQETAYPIGKIARLVGYPDVFAFSKIFKKHVGVSPRLYRDHLHNSQDENDDDCESSSNQS